MSPLLLGLLSFFGGFIAACGISAILYFTVITNGATPTNSTSESPDSPESPILTDTITISTISFENQYTSEDGNSLTATYSGQEFTQSNDKFTTSSFTLDSGVNFKPTNIWSNNSLMVLMTGTVTSDDGTTNQQMMFGTIENVNLNLVALIDPEDASKIPWLFNVDLTSQFTLTSTQMNSPEQIPASSTFTSDVGDFFITLE